MRQISGYDVKRITIYRQGVVLGILFLAFAIRLYRLSSVPLNMDEIITISRYVPLSVLEIFGTYHSNNHALASMLAHIFSPEADNLFLLRWPLVLVGMLALPFLYRLSTDLFGQIVGLVSLLLFSLTPVNIGYSVVLRGYIGLISCTVISLYFLSSALRSNRWAAWVGFATANFVVIHFHMFGLVATWTQLGLVGLWFLWRYYQDGIARKLLKPRLLKYGLITLVIAVFQAPVVFARTTSILANESWGNHFAAWNDGSFSMAEEILPLVSTVNLLAPMSAGGIGLYVCLFFFVIGLVHLWLQWRPLAIAAFIWFCAPFVAIFVAMQISSGFFAYERFTLYLLPTFLIVVALGMVSLAEWLLAMASSRGPQWRSGAWGVVGISAAGLVLLFAVSTQWYLRTTTHIDWWKMSQVLSRELHSEDIVICEEDHGFDVPDGGKAYCSWMLELFIPELERYTSNFQSSTNFVVNYNYLQERRSKLLKPGGIWLVLWRRIIFHPGMLVTNTEPITEPLPLQSAFAPYPSWNFGSATLVHINTGSTLLENIQKALDLLLTVEQSPADRARYYRSLAELEAFQGQKEQALAYFDASWHTVEQAGGQYPDLFLLDTRPFVERIPETGPLPDEAVVIGQQFGPALCLRGYQIEPAVFEAGNSVTLTLYWQALDFIEQDYGYVLRLDDDTGQTHGQFEFAPFDRTYPTPWWWAGQQLIEARQLVIPVELAGGNYVVQFGAYDHLAADQEFISPLFYMSLQAGEPSRWKAKAITDQDVDCP